MCRIESHSGDLNGRTRIEHILGETSDISNYPDFYFYCRFWFKEDAVILNTRIGRCLVVVDSILYLMSYWVLSNTGVPEFRNTAQQVIETEKSINEQTCKLKDMMKK